ncbi:N-carbamoyl-D-amino-acid hydrolase [Aureimonas fodinaquatilis]|uniref:N-carbamoyl-D-amino-acid hydrolase n=1 Tax=Aureimonas fodinaquatilis TaxID=2565783 RepID=A0A5B0DYV4_9HYPH|nr:N-carbamoyl-D-amino-acid hydrolase [Aureimonas fodinaquatilis]KAA0971974.1 N-carbamoyl-D-amino-acid hydrolase [Aureimonas fodinaquatilis]
MSRKLNLAVAQLGPIHRSESRSAILGRLMEMMREAKGRGAELVVFPEAALTSFFPRWFIEDEAELDSYYETAMPNPSVQPLFDLAVQLGIGFHLGYAELAWENGRKRRFNTAVLVDRNGRVVGKYRKIHLPGHADYEADRPFQNLEKRYFEVGDLGFPVYSYEEWQVGMCICNDRRWPEAWRMLGLNGAELVCLGYNTPVTDPRTPQHSHLTSFHHLLSVQAGAYQNGVWAAAAGKAGVEEGWPLVGHSCIVAPSGEVVALTSSVEDEVISAVCNFERNREIREHIFNFEKHRQPHTYRKIAE